jgi:lipopolysaccharide export system protein LptA
MEISFKMKLFPPIVSWCLLLALVCLGPARQQCIAQQTKETGGISSENPIVIHSDTLLFDQEQGLITFEGKVKASSNDLVVDCNKMIVYINENQSGESGLESGRIEKIIALGDVVINRSDGGIARAGKAVFYQKEEKVVLTENPSVQQGPDLAEGHRIVLYLKENRSIIEGSGEKRVKATLFPKEEKKEQ